MVVTVVSKIGRIRWPRFQNGGCAFHAACDKALESVINAIELLTTIPAKATTPVPLIITLNV